MLAALAEFASTYRERLAFSLAAASAATLIVTGLYVVGATDEREVTDPRPPRPLPADPSTSSVPPSVLAMPPLAPNEILVIVPPAPADTSRSPHTAGQLTPDIVTQTITAAATETSQADAETTTAPAPPSNDCANNPVEPVCVIVQDVGRLGRGVLELLGP
ncbi:hypothetical protein MOQ72_02090 [Saccharopolyspora sp. K220]|uniref:hypothetical protein n=1 Tax=Saccharopolyspora soli TaxID=2926618 RepID=UPI001F56070F|nr:hypothetical protein [Saccharopolyspora soli]MCI2416201.1 hypothetical protein [Saccharopolyspora soli]